MQKKLLIFIVLSLCVVSGVLLYFFQETVIRTVNPLISYFDKSQSSLQIEFIDQTNSDLNFIFTENFPHHEEYFAFLKDSPIVGNKINVIITNNVEVAEVKFYKAKEVISGFTGETKDETSTIQIYVAKDLEDARKFHEINNSFLAGLLYVSESQKVIASNRTYFPELEAVNNLTHKILVESYDTNNYALKKIK